MGSDVSNLVDLEDTALVAQAQDGDRKAFSELVLRHQKAVYRVCYRLLDNPEDAEDAAQDAFLRAYDRLHTFESRSSFKTWMTRLAVNVSLNQRGRRKGFDPLFDGHKSNEPGPESEAVRAETVSEVREALKLLPENHRTAVTLHDLEGMEYREIADALEIPEGTVKGWVHRGRMRLKELLT